jgi:hypothetical protein
MRHNAIDHFIRHKHQKAIKAQIAVAGAASPPGSLIPYRDATVIDLKQGGIIFDLFGNDLQRSFG